MLLECDYQFPFTSFYYIVWPGIDLRFFIATNTVIVLILFTGVDPCRRAGTFTNSSNPFLIFVFIRINNNSSFPFIYKSRQILILI